MRRELQIDGMDCAGCARHVQSALEGVPGVEEADVRLVSEKADVALDPSGPPTLQALEQAVEKAGYEVRPEESATDGTSTDPEGHTRSSLGLLAAVAALVLAVTGLGHGLGVFDWLQAQVPWYLGLAAVVGLGVPVFRNVGEAAWHGRVTAHTLMTVGVIAALVTGEWMTAFVIVIFMRVGDYVEHLTTDRARSALRQLVHAAPQTARVEREETEIEVPVEEVGAGEVVVVRPGEKIPVDGTVVGGAATVDLSAITGEPMPVEVGTGDEVYAATIAQGGGLRIRTEQVGADTTFGRVVQMVEEAEGHQGQVQKWADQFSGYYLPVVGTVAAVTYLVSGDAMATVAVLVVACSCAFALATPVAMLASIGTVARRGLLVKGGRYLETLTQADVLLVDKTGTLTLGTPQIVEVVPQPGQTEEEVLRLAAAAEHYADHPLADAVREAAAEREISSPVPSDFETVPGEGIRARVDGRTITVGNRRMVEDVPDELSALDRPGCTLLHVTVEGKVVGRLVAADEARAGVTEALEEVRAAGIEHIEVLTGDREASAVRLAERLGLEVRAELLPEDKIDVVKTYQEQGHTVVMVGDGVNDAPALAQADVGIAMGGVGTDIAIDAAPVVLMREDWRLIPALFRTARRTLRVVKGNFVFTGVYNLAALSFAATGLLPPIWAAALHAVPDLGILVNSSRLLRGEDEEGSEQGPASPLSGAGEHPETKEVPEEAAEEPGRPSVAEGV